ncbi:hypothetical protein ACFXG4_39725 [Nocardia sp. NPDC059246]|uniref:hypothetical protein n=1 Tax=unclassified Nocardia TaxID=2637762 RepID=UPI0036840F71
MFHCNCAGLVGHQDRKPGRLRARSSLAALDPDEYPVLATHLDAISELFTSDAVFHDGLRRLIASWAAGAS